MAGPLRHLGELARAQARRRASARADGEALGEDREFVAAAELARLPEEIGAVSGEIELAALPRADLGRDRPHLTR